MPPGYNSCHVELLQEHASHGKCMYSARQPSHNKNGGHLGCWLRVRPVSTILSTSFHWKLTMVLWIILSSFSWWEKWSTERLGNFLEITKAAAETDVKSRSLTAEPASDHYYVLLLCYVMSSTHIYVIFIMCLALFWALKLQMVSWKSDVVSTLLEIIFQMGIIKCIQTVGLPSLHEGVLSFAGTF